MHVFRTPVHGPEMPVLAVYRYRYVCHVSHVDLVLWNMTGNVVL
jgi:hypothetical protein